MYELMGRAHAWLAQERGQGTVEYVGLLVLLAGIMAAVLAAGGKSDIAQTIVNKIANSIKNLG
jgi:hypothetical protein